MPHHSIMTRPLLREYVVWWIGLSVAMLLSVSAGFGTLDAQEASSADPQIRLARGDALRIAVWNRPELSGEFEILINGRLAHPLLQNLRVVGRTFSEVEADVFEYLSRFQNNPQALVTPLVRISVGGGVGQPGIVSIDPRAQLLELIGLAGGPASNAELDQVQLVRRGQVDRVSLWGPQVGMQTLVNLDVRSGDQVIVPVRRSPWRDYIYPSVVVLGSLLGIVNLIVQISR